MALGDISSRRCMRYAKLSTRKNPMIGNFDLMISIYWRSITQKFGIFAGLQL